MFKKLFAILSGASTAVPRAASGDWVVGGLYVTPHDRGTFVPLKILEVDERGVHIRVYSNGYAGIPDGIDESTLYMAGVDNEGGEPMGMGHLPISMQSFSSWGAIFVQQSSVATEELEGYRTWLEADGGYF